MLTDQLLDFDRSLALAPRLVQGFLLLELGHDLGFHLLKGPDDSFGKSHGVQLVVGVFFEQAVKLRTRLFFPIEEEIGRAEILAGFEAHDRVARTRHRTTDQ